VSTRLAAVLLLVATAASAAERLADPVRAFVEGYDPSGNDFFANTPERTVLLRIRADLDGDGRKDLAVSDSSTWGNAGGQWLLFRAQADGTYRYWGTLFFSPGAVMSLPFEQELLVYVRTSVSRGSLIMYRFEPSGITRTDEEKVNLETPSDRERYEQRFPPGGGQGGLPVEHCKLMEYRRDPAGCWRPGLGLR
jgi:hypothetical protein